MFNTYDVVEMVANEAVSQFGHGWIVSAEATNRLKQCCEITDAILKESFGEEVEAEVIPGSKELVISLLCGDFVFEHGRTHPFFTLIQSADRFGFFNANDGESVRLSLVFKDIFIQV